MFAATFAARHLVLTRPACLAFWFSQQRGCPAPTGGGPLAGPLLPATAPRAGGAHGHQRASKVGRKAGRDQPATLQLEGGCGRIFHGQKIKADFQAGAAIKIERIQAWGAGNCFPAAVFAPYSLRSRPVRRGGPTALFGTHTLIISSLHQCTRPVQLPYAVKTFRGQQPRS